MVMTNELKYFKPHEFQGWFEFMDLDLLQELDDLRHAWGKPIRISPAPGATGRRLGESMSYHNFDRWGCVKAVDVMPDGLDCAVCAIEFDRLSRPAFKGIGLYPHWKPSPGFHLDVRKQYARWGAIKIGKQQHYVSFEHALVKFNECEDD